MDSLVVVFINMYCDHGVSKEVCCSSYITLAVMLLKWKAVGKYIHFCSLFAVFVIAFYYSVSVIIPHKHSCIIMGKQKKKY